MESLILLLQGEVLRVSPGVPVDSTGDTQGAVSVPSSAAVDAGSVQGGLLTATSVQASPSSAGLGRTPSEIRAIATRAGRLFERCLYSTVL